MSSILSRMLQVSQEKVIAHLSALQSTLSRRSRQAQVNRKCSKSRAAPSNENQWWQTLHIESPSSGVDFKLDSGALISVLPMHCYSRLHNPPTFVPTTKKNVLLLCTPTRDRWNGQPPFAHAGPKGSVFLRFYFMHAVKLYSAGAWITGNCLTEPGKTHEFGEPSCAFHG